MTPPRPHWPTLIGIAAIGLALRVAAAHGGLWLDEAWSAVFARDVGTPMGVLAGIHHDNNHALNTLWLLIAGFDAHPAWQRALSIACGTATIIVAGLFGWRRGTAAGIATAALFALSPTMLTYGSEARGYAPMLLALVAFAALVDRAIDGGERPRGLVAAAVLGMAAQLTMAFGLAAVGLWAVARLGTLRAVRLLWLPALAAVLTGVALVGVPIARGWFTFGNLEPFAFAAFADSLGVLAGYTLGLPAHPLSAALVAVAVLAGLAVTPGRRVLYAAAILGIPLTMAVLQPMNGAIARYYLPSAAVLLLMAGEVGGWLWRRQRITAAALGLALLIGMASRDTTLIADRRADPLPAIAAMAARSPGGARVAVERDRSSAILESAAAVRGYPIAIARCARFVFVERDGTAPFPTPARWCGHPYRAIAEAHPAGLSGTHWTLYEIAR